MLKKRDISREFFNIIITVFAAALSALGLHVFVLPANFAPSGVDGIATMLNFKTGINTGIFTFSLNLPLLIMAWFVLKKRYVIYTLIFTALSSLMLGLLQGIDFYQFTMENEKLLAALVSGVIFGIRTGVMLKIEASTGGADIMAGVIHKYNSHINVENIITVICCMTIFASVFVYHDFFSILLSFVQMFVFDRAAEFVLKDTRHAVEFKIVTTNPELLTDKIIYELKHGATIIESKGIYTGENKSMISTVINVRQIPELLKIVKEDKDAFVYFTEAKGVRGNFRWRKDDEVK